VRGLIHSFWMLVAYAFPLKSRVEFSVPVMFSPETGRRFV
jgi:hypothetical protein